MAFHGPNGRGQKTTGIIGVGFAGSYYGFLADNPFAIQDFQIVQGIIYLPMAGSQLNGILALVLYGDGIAKSKMHFVVFEESTFKTGVYRNLYSLGYLSNHNCLVCKNVSRKEKHYTEQC